MLGFVGAEERHVDQVQVDVVDAELLQRGADGGRDVFDFAADFGGEEELGARDAAVFDGLAQLGFGAVGFGAVEVGVAEFEGCGAGGYAGLVDFAAVADFVPGGACAEAQLETLLGRLVVGGVRGNGPWGCCCHR